MTVLAGPANQPVPEVYTASPNPSSYDDSLVNFIGPFAAHMGDVWTASFTSAVKTAGGPAFDIYVKEITQLGANAFVGQFASPAWASVTGGATYNYTIPHDGTFFTALLDGGNGISGGGGTGTLFAFELQTTGLAPGAYCAGGTRRKDSTQDLVVLGGTAVDAIGIFLGGVWVNLISLLVDAIGVHVLSTATLCASTPPTMPTITTSDYLALTGVTGAPTTDQIAKFWQAVQSAAWPYFCECIPGTGIVPPPAPAPPSITITLPPPVSCDGMDLCAMLDLLARKVDMVSLDLQYARRDITLIQRQGVPFGYVPGILHTGLTGAGQFSVSDIIGLSVESTSIPARPSATMAPVNSWFRLGEVSLGTADGWERRDVITHNPHLLLPVSGALTEVGWSNEPGVTWNIRELLREP